MRIKDMKAGDKFYCAVGAEDMAIANCEWVVVAHSVVAVNGYGGSTLCCYVSNSGVLLDTEYLDGEIEVQIKKQAKKRDYLYNVKDKGGFTYKGKAYLKLNHVPYTEVFKVLCADTDEVTSMRMTTIVEIE